MNSTPSPSFKIYLVGGAVRDQFLGVPVADRDWVVVGATPEQMLAQGFQQVGKDFPVFLHPDTKEEYALARTERKQGQGYHGFKVFSDPSVTLEEDLIRRDLTINAMAQDPETGEVIDPYGGQQDLQNRVLRHVSPAFEEDPLRVLRVARFYAKLAPFGFRLAPETQVLMQKMANSGELQSLTPERVWQEIAKALMTAQPSQFFACLKAADALKILMPEIDCLFKVPQSPKHHPEGDAGTHTLMVVDASAKAELSLNSRFACLMHDVGKCATDPQNWPKHPEHEKLGALIVSEFCQRYRLPKETTQFAKHVTRWHGEIHKGLDYAKQKKAEALLEVLEQTQAYKQPEAFEALLQCCEADHHGRKGFENMPYPQHTFWQQARAVSEPVSIPDILKDGYQGKAIQQQIHLRRLAALAQWLTQRTKMAEGTEKQINGR